MENKAPRVCICDAIAHIIYTLQWLDVFYTILFSTVFLRNHPEFLEFCSVTEKTATLFSFQKYKPLCYQGDSAKWSSISANLPSTWGIQNCLSCPQLPQPRYCSFKYILIQNFDMLHCIKKYPYLSKYKVIEPHADHHKVSQFLSPLWHFHTSDSA